MSRVDAETSNIPRQAKDDSQCVKNHAHDTPTIDDKVGIGFIYQTYFLRRYDASDYNEASPK